MYVSGKMRWLSVEARKPRPFSFTWFWVEDAPALADNEDAAGNDALVDGAATIGKVTEGVVW